MLASRALPAYWSVDEICSPPLPRLFQVDTVAAAFHRTLPSPELRTSVTAPLMSVAARMETVDLDGHFADAEAAAAGVAKFERWLVGPERGARQLIRDALELYRAPVLATVATVAAVLHDAVEAAMQAAAPQHGGGDDCGQLSAELAGHAHAVVDAWAAECEAQLSGLLEAEQQCPSNGEFEALRHTLATPQLLLSSADSPGKLGAELGAGPEVAEVRSTPPGAACAPLPPPLPHWHRCSLPPTHPPLPPIPPSRTAST